MRVLVVEDDDRVAAALRAALERHEMQVERVSRGLAVLPHLAGTDVVLLDLGLPDVDGLEVCRRIREAGDVPVIVVSARGRVDERILGLHHGADDYLVKPYDVGELVARIHAVRRRRGVVPPTGGTPATVAELGDGVVLDRARHALTVDGEEVALSRKEFAVLALLAEADGAVCTRDRLVAEVWGRRWPGADRTLDVHVATLRTKLARPGMVATVRGVGYRLTAGADRRSGV
ncbi:response regulator transcription factor [Actinomycetospora chibensis]|uniref:Sensory transduction protein RegX3 n=1 Tax=Actinomycetospora chibensis TaxID=663606 RepID=A0ABV9RQ98_9PSEU|nr:response regulator transcription factor [Actinomycetospora chibensis]MDD7924477.1 response regulator transcription factor [Actinomycetospora chibensis]